jgi:heptosyltransferase II
MTSSTLISEAQTILLALPNWVGDAVMATPALAALRAGCPQARVLFLGRAAPLATVGDETLCDETIPIRRGFGETLRTAGAIRRAGPIDLALLLPNSFRSAMTARLGGAGHVIGYRRDGRSWLLSGGPIPPRNPDGSLRVYPAREYYIDLIEHLGLTVTDRALRLAYEEALAANLLSEVAFDPARPLVMLNPGGAFGPSKLWPTQRYADLADRLIETRNAQIIVNAAPGEQYLAAAVVEAMTGPVLLDFSRRDNSIPLLKSLLARCDLLVTNDTGARHIGVACGAAVVTIFGSTDPAWTTLDAPRERLVSASVDCAPCQEKVCPLPSDSPNFHQCMTSIGVETVYQAAAELLGLTRAEGRA